MADALRKPALTAPSPVPSAKPAGRHSPALAMLNMGEHTAPPPTGAPHSQRSHPARQRAASPRRPEANAARVRRGKQKTTRSAPPQSRAKAARKPRKARRTPPHRPASKPAKTPELRRRAENAARVRRGKAKSEHALNAAERDALRRLDLYGRLIRYPDGWRSHHRDATLIDPAVIGRLKARELVSERTVDLGRLECEITTHGRRYAFREPTHA